jgi:glucose/arabinose dehydrogenase
VLVAFGLLIGGIAIGVASCGESPDLQDQRADADVARPPNSNAATDAPDAAPASDGATDARRPLTNTCGDAGTLGGTWLVDSRLCLTVFAEQVVNGRQQAFAPNGDLFVLANTRVLTLFDQDKNLVIDDQERSVFTESLVGEPPFTHGLAFDPDGKFLYVSNMTTVYRWPYASGAHVAVGTPEIVVYNMPTAGHDSRTLVFDAQHRLYVNIGSLDDVDVDPDVLAVRAQVRRFTIPTALPQGGLAYASGELFASGLRNEVGLAIDTKGRVWGVENGNDSLGEDNPGEELNRLDSPNRFFGFPDCWSEYVLDGGLGPGTQWRMPAFGLFHTDAWCQDPKNVQRPAAVMPGHWAPLGVIEVVGGSLPWEGDLIIASHGSTFRTVPNGRVLARAQLAGDKVVGITPIVGHLAIDGGLEEGAWDARPVDVRMGPEGALYISENMGHRILRLGYRP